MNNITYAANEHSNNEIRFNQLFSTILSLIPALIFLVVKIIIWKLYRVWIEIKSKPLSTKSYRDRDYIKDAESHSYLDLKI
jgi:hypothetical protein